MIHGILANISPRFIDLQAYLKKVKSYSIIGESGIGSYKDYSFKKYSVFLVKPISGLITIKILFDSKLAISTKRIS